MSWVSASADNEASHGEEDHALGVPKLSKFESAHGGSRAMIAARFMPASRLALRIVNGYPNENRRASG
jgi:hypothetical protein